MYSCTPKWEIHPFYNRSLRVRYVAIQEKNKVRCYAWYFCSHSLEQLTSDIERSVGTIKVVAWIVEEVGTSSIARRAESNINKLDRAGITSDIPR